MKIKVVVTLKNGVLDPQGKAIQQTLNGMGFSSVNEVRQGKFFEVDVNEKDEDMCKKLLANLVIENFEIL
jgi:phosphoribosylformylglycinamidine synthase PurS subunit